MAVPSVFSDLSTTAASNSPAGSDNVFPTLDEHIRALAAFLASIYANTATNGWVSPYAKVTAPTITGTMEVQASGGAHPLKIQDSAGNTAVNAGYLGVPANTQDANYTCVLADAGKMILHTSASTHTHTIPANASVAYPVGTTLTFVNANGGGDVTIAITSDTLYMAPTGSTGSRTLAANGRATAVKLTSTTWQIAGAGLS